MKNAQQMVIPTADLGGFEPYNAAHAIVGCTITVQFPGHINGPDWITIKSAALSAARELGLGVPQPFYGLNVSFDGARAGVSLNAPTPAVSQIGGLTFGRLDEDDQLLERIIVARDGIIISNNSYVRWGSFFERAQVFLKAVFPAYRAIGPCGGYKLEYWDRFDKAEGVKEHNAFGVIAPQSEYVSRRAIDEVDPWHSYSGHFIRVNDQVRRLVNVRVDCGDYQWRDGNMRRSILIYSMNHVALGAPGYLDLPEGFSIEALYSGLQDQHVRLKTILEEIISPEAKQRIGL